MGYQIFSCSFRFFPPLFSFSLPLSPTIRFSSHSSFRSFHAFASKKDKMSTTESSQYKIPAELKPALKTLLRAYSVGWGITTVPGLLSVIIKSILSATKQQNKSASILSKALFLTIPKLLKKSVTKSGFPLLIAGSFGGQKFIQFLLNNKEEKKKKISQKSAIFWSALISIWSIRRAFPKIKTLDLTFFVLVRAFDVFAHRIYVSPKVRQKVPEWTLEYGNIVIFMLASTEIIFSWFYEPERLPRSVVYL